MPFEPDHELLRQYVRARDGEDLAQAAHLWGRLVLNNFDRVNQAVKAFRFSAGGSGIPQDEHGSAASEAYLRVMSMGTNFAGREPGQFYAALWTCVDNSCKDFGRKELRHDKRAAGSLDQTFDPGGEAGPYDAALAAYDAELQAQAHDAIEAEVSIRQAEGLIAWGISQIPNDNYREVLELTLLHELPAEEIAARLGISLANVYARRSRGVKALEKILREHGS